MEKNKIRWFRIFLFLLIFISLILPLLNDNLLQFCFPILIVAGLILIFTFKHSFQIFLSVLIAVSLILSLSGGNLLPRSLLVFIVTTLSLIFIRRHDIFKPNLNKIILFLIISSILIFYLVMPSLYIEDPECQYLLEQKTYPADTIMPPQCASLECGWRCRTIAVLENNKCSCATCCKDLILEDDCKYRCKDVIPLEVTAGVVFSYLISSIVIYLLKRSKIK